MAGDYRHAIEHSYDAMTQALVLVMLRRNQEAIARLHEVVRQFRHAGQSDSSMLQKWAEALGYLAQGRHADALDILRGMPEPLYHDPETLYYASRQFAFLGETELALRLLQRTVDEGFFCADTLARDTWLDGLRAHPAFAAISARASAKRGRALAAFLDAGGDQLLGLTDAR
jgi:hypothetical protein